MSTLADTHGMKKVIQLMGWLGVATSWLGAALLALNIPVSKYGYVLFFASSLLMAWYAFRKSDMPFVIQNLFFICVNALGCYRWVLLPTILGT